MLKSPDVPPVRSSRNSNRKIINIRKHNPSGYRYVVKHGNINHKQQRRDRRTLRSSNLNRSEDARGTLENQAALPTGEERSDPRDEIMRNTLGAEDGGEGGG